MIAIVLLKPNGTGGFEPALGFTTHSTAITKEGVSCLPGFLSSVGVFSNRANISQAQGCAPEAVEWSFDLTDWTGSVRRSVAILDGTAQLVGWRVNCYTSPDGSDDTWFGPVLGALAMEIVEAPVSDGTIAISCREAWVGNLQTVGLGAGDTRVGVVFGGAKVSVKSPDIGEPIDYQYSQVSPGLRTGRPHEATAVGVLSKTATAWETNVGNWRFRCRFSNSSSAWASYDRMLIFTHISSEMDSDQLGYQYICTTKDDADAIYSIFLIRQEISSALSYDVQQLGHTLFFQCSSPAESDALFAQMKAGLSSGQVFVAGSEYSEAVTDISQDLEDKIAVQTSRFFHAVEPDATKISAHAQATAFAPVVGWAKELSGWIADSGVVLPKGQVEMRDGVAYFAPSVTSADGFISSTLIPTEIAFQDGEWTRTDSDLAYYGSTASIPTNATSAASDALDSSTLAPTAGTSSFGIWGHLVYPSFSTANFGFRVRALDLDTATKYSRIYADQDIRLAIKSNGSAFALYGWPFNSDPIQGTGPLSVSSPMYLGIARNGGIENNEKQIFSDINGANAEPQFIINSSTGPGDDLYFYFQARSMSFYGASTLKFGSSYAVVQPAYSIPPADAITNFLSLAGADFVADVPTLRPPKSKWGRYFEPNLTYSDAARELAKEMWITLGRGTNGLIAGVEGEILQQPSITMGDRTDVITEPVVEYDQWAGEYKKKAYIAHVDEEYNSATPDRYFGGWDNGSDPAGYGMSIWNHCRKAYLHHGIRASETYQAPSIYDPDTMGRSWFGSRNGRTRTQWLSLQARYMTLRIRDASPSWWAGNTVQIPTSVAGWAGYNLTEFANQQLIVTEKSWDPMTLESSFEVAIPPAIPQIGDNLIQQTFDADDELIQQSFSLDDTLIQQVF